MQSATKRRPPNAGKGRAKGVPNRVTKALKEMILGALEMAHDDGGQAYLAQCAKEHPPAFMALLGRALPLTLAGDPNAPVNVIHTIGLIGVKPEARRTD